MKTNSKIVRNLIKLHILESVHDDNENVFASFKEAANHLNNDFKRVSDHPYNLQKFPNPVNRFNDYLCGLPFWFLMLYNEDLENFLNGLGINPDGKKYSGDKMRALYAHLIYKEIENF